jgi:hypothetical protein
MDTALGSGHGKQRDPSLLIDGVRLSLESWLDDPENEAAREPLGQQLDELTQLSRTQGQEKIARIGAEMNHLLELVTEDPSRMSEVIVDTLKQSFTAITVLAGRRMTLRTTSPAMPAPSEVESERDASVHKASVPSPATLQSG